MRTRWSQVGNPPPPASIARTREARVPSTSRIDPWHQSASPRWPLGTSPVWQLGASSLEAKGITPFFYSVNDFFNVCFYVHTVSLSMGWARPFCRGPFWSPQFCRVMLLEPSGCAAVPALRLSGFLPAAAVLDSFGPIRHTPIPSPCFPIAFHLDFGPSALLPYLPVCPLPPNWCSQCQRTLHGLRMPCPGSAIV